MEKYIDTKVSYYSLILYHRDICCVVALILYGQKFFELMCDAVDKLAAWYVVVLI